MRFLPIVERGMSRRVRLGHSRAGLVKQERLASATHQMMAAAKRSGNSFGATALSIAAYFLLESVTYSPAATRVSKTVARGGNTMR